MELFICQPLSQNYLSYQARPLLSSRAKWLGCLSYVRLYSSSRTLLINLFIISFSASVIQKLALLFLTSSGKRGRPAFGRVPPLVIINLPLLCSTFANTLLPFLFLFVVVYSSSSIYHNSEFDFHIRHIT